MLYEVHMQNYLASIKTLFKFLLKKKRHVCVRNVLGRVENDDIITNIL